MILRTIPGGFNAAAALTANKRGEESLMMNALDFDSNLRSSAFIGGFSSDLK